MGRRFAGQLGIGKRWRNGRWLCAYSERGLLGFRDIVRAMVLEEQHWCASAYVGVVMVWCLIIARGLRRSYLSVGY